MKAKRKFIEALIAASRENKIAPETSATLLRLFLEFGSETPDNLSCSEHIEFGEGTQEPNNARTLGLKIKGKNVFLSEIMYAIEDNELKEVRAAFKNLTNEEWNAATRMMTMVMIALESD